MALPLTGLTLHVDASDADHLFTTFVSGGPNTGTVTDGATVAVWTSEEGVDRIWKQSGASNLPVWRQSSPLLPLPCLDFSGVATQRMLLQTQTAGAVPLSQIITAAAYTVVLSFYAETITSASVGYAGANPLIADLSGYFGVFVTVDAGVPKVFAYNYDGTQDYVALPVTIGAPHVVMVRHDSGSVFLSLDGGAETSVASGATTLLTGAVCLGVGTTSAVTFDGRLGEVAVYNTALTGTALTDALAYFTTKWVAGAPAGPAVLAGEIDRRVLTTATGALNATWTPTTTGAWTAGLVALKKT